jgi:hypothetical protein
MSHHVFDLMLMDFKAIRSERATFIPILMSFIFAPLLTVSQTVIGLIFSLYSISSYAILIFGLEERYHAYRYTASLGVSRRDIVIARYGNTLAMTVIYLACVFLLNTLFIFIGNPAARPIPFSHHAVLIAAVLLFSAMTLPFYFALGLTKARAVILPLWIIPITVPGLFMLLSPGVGLGSWASAFTSSRLLPFGTLTCLIVMGAAVVLWGASISLSVLLYSRKDL